jgi:hypothetical protein
LSSGEGGEVGSDPEGFPEVVSEGSDIGSSPALEEKVGDGRGVIGNFKLIDVDAFGWAGNFFAPACFMVEAFALDFDRAIHRGDLFYLADKLLGGFPDLLEGYARDVPLGYYSAFRIVGIGGDTQSDFPDVHFGFQLEIFEESGGDADPHHQQTRSDGIQRSGMPHPARAEPIANPLDGVVGSDVGGFVDQEDAHFPPFGLVR